VIITINRKRITINDSTADLLLKYKDTIDQMVNFWDKHMTYMERNRKNMHRPRVVDLVSEAMLKIYAGNYTDMPLRCKNYFTDIRESSDFSMRRLRNTYIRYGNPTARYCIEAYISKQYDKMSAKKQPKIGNTITVVKNKRKIEKKKERYVYTKNKYRLTRGTAYNARKKLGW